MSEFESLETANGLSITISATMGGVDLAAKTLGGKLALFTEPDKAFSLVLGAREALNNAFAHGSGSDGTKKSAWR